MRHGRRGGYEKKRKVPEKDGYFEQVPPGYYPSYREEGVFKFNHGYRGVLHE